MAGPLSGLVGAQQQVPLSSPSQVGQNNNQVRGQDDRQRPEENRVQPQAAAPAEAQDTSADNNLQAREQDNLLARRDELLEQGGDQRRGSLVDISV